MNKGLRIAVFLIVMASSNLSWSQSPKEFESIQQKYARYNAVVINDASHFTFDIVKDSLLVTQENIKEILILSEHSKAHTNEYVFHGSFTALDKLEAYSLLPEGNKYRKIKVESFKETNSMGGNSFYDDSRITQFAYPSLDKNVRTYLKYNLAYTDPRFIRTFFFQSYIPVVKTIVTAKVHKNVELGFRLYHQEIIPINHKVYSKGNYTYYEWEATNLSPYKYRTTNHFSLRHFSPHIALYVKQTNIKGVTKKYYDGIDELFLYYTELLGKMDTTHSDDLKTLVHKLTTGLAPTEQAKAIFYWVQDNIKYIAYSDGYQGFIPASPTEVFQKRFGDCKGMSSIIVEMMRIAGLKAHYSWVGTRSIPYTYQQAPLPFVDNHMVAAFLHNDSTYIMDATIRYIDFGKYPMHIQNKEILIGLDKKNYQIFTVPVSKTHENTVNDSISIRLEGNSIKGIGRRIHTGHNKTEIAEALSGTKEADLNKKISNLFSKGNNTFKINDFAIGNLYERDKPAMVDYSFSLENYARVIGDEIFLNLNLNKSFQDYKLDTSKTYAPIVNDFAFIEKEIIHFQIPEGYTVQHLPSNDTISTESLYVSLSYSLVNNAIVFVKEIKADFLMIPDENISQWNSAIDKLNSNYRLSTVLKKKN